MKLFKRLKLSRFGSASICAQAGVVAGGDVVAVHKFSMIAERPDREPATSRRKAAVEFLLTRGFVWDGFEWRMPATGRELTSFVSWHDNANERSTINYPSARAGWMARAELARLKL